MPKTAEQHARDSRRRMAPARSGRRAALGADQDEIGRVQLRTPAPVGSREFGDWRSEQMLVDSDEADGSKKKPFFRVVVTEARSARESSFVENVGTYNPRSKPAQVEINKERMQHWISSGAQPSDSVRTLLDKHLTQRPVGSRSRAPAAQ